MTPSKEYLEKANRIFKDAKNETRRLETEKKRKKKEALNLIKIEMKKEYIQLKKNMKQYEAAGIIADKYGYAIETTLYIISITRIPKEKKQSKINIIVDM